MHLNCLEILYLNAKQTNKPSFPLLFEKNVPTNFGFCYFKCLYYPRLAFWSGKFTLVASLQILHKLLRSAVPLRGFGVSASASWHRSQTPERGSTDEPRGVCASRRYPSRCLSRGCRETPENQKSPESTKKEQIAVFFFFSEIQGQRMGNVGEKDESIR